MRLACACAKARRSCTTPGSRTCARGGRCAWGDGALPTDGQGIVVILPTFGHAGLFGSRTLRVTSVVNHVLYVASSIRKSVIGLIEFFTLRLYGSSPWSRYRFSVGKKASSWPHTHTGRTGMFTAFRTAV